MEQKKDIFEALNEAIISDPERAVGWSWSSSRKKGVSHECRHKLHDYTDDTVSDKGRTLLFDSGRVYEVATGCAMWFSELFAQLKGLSKEAAEEELLRLYGIEATQHRRNVTNAEALTALFEEGCTALLNDTSLRQYYTERRGLTVQQLTTLKVGKLTPDRLHRLNSLLSFRFSEGVVNYVSSHASSFAFVPYWSGGRIVSAILHNTAPEAKAKYLYAEGFPKQNYTLGLHGIPEAPTDPSTVYVVEGVFDCYHAQLSGLYAVGLLGVAMSDRTAEDIRKHLQQHIGSSVVLCLDCDTAGMTATPKVARLLTSKGLHVSQLCYLSQYNSSIHDPKDIDELLTTAGVEGAVEYLRTQRTGALSAEVMNLIQTTPKPEDGQPVSVDVWFRYVESLTELCRIYADDLPAQRSDIEQLTKQFFGRVVTTADIAELNNRKKNEAERQKVSDLIEAAKQNGDTKTVSVLLRQLSALYAQQTDFADINSRFSGREVAARIAATDTKIMLPYWVKNPKSGFVERVFIPSSGLTVVAGKTGHCKSTFCENLFRQFVYGDMKHGFSPVSGHSVFYSYEEHEDDIVRRIVNQQFFDSYGTQSRTAREEAIKAAAEAYIHEHSHPNAALSAVVSRVFGGYDTEYSLRHCSALQTVEALAEQLTRYSQSHELSAVFVDYIQRQTSQIALRGNVTTKNELRQVVFVLEDLARQLSVPIVCAAQYNRELKSPSGMLNDNVADCSEIEKVASAVFGLWNTTETVTEDERDEVLQRIAPEATAIQNRGFTPIYMKVTKNRSMSKGGEVLLHFDPVTARVSMGDGSLTFANRGTKNSAAVPIDSARIQLLTGFGAVPLNELTQTAPEATVKPKKQSGKSAYWDTFND